MTKSRYLTACLALSAVALLLFRRLRMVSCNHKKCAREDTTMEQLDLSVILLELPDH